MKLRAGRVSINEGGGDRSILFGGYKMSGNGRERGEFGFVEYLETKAILGFRAGQAAEWRPMAFRAGSSETARR